MKKLNIFGPIGNWSDCVGVQTVSTFLDGLSAGEEFEVYINSPGGSVFEGIAIYNLLSEYSKQMTIKIIGEASSIASVIVCAGESEKVLIAETAMMLIHNPWTFAIVDEEYIKKLQKNLATMKEAIMVAYVRKTGLSREELNSLMLEGDYHAATKCETMGFAKVYIPSADEQQTIKASNDIKQSLMMKNIIMNLNIDKFSSSPEPTLDEVEGDNYLMNIEQLQAENASLQSQISAMTKTSEDFKAQILNDLSAVKAELSTVQTERDQAKADAQAKTQEVWLAEETAFCNELIMAKKLTKAELTGNSKDGETPAKVNKLLKLRNLDESLYNMERAELQARASFESLTADLDIPDEIEGKTNDLVAFVKTEYNEGRK